MASIPSSYHLRSARLIFLPILVGMLTAQAIATIFVFLSNSRVLAATDAVGKAGLLSIPTGPAKATLTGMAPAFWGGLFFTLSIGIGLTLVSWALMRLWDFAFKRHRSVLAGYGAIWAALLIMVNINGATLFPMLFCLLVPPATAAATFMGLRSEPPTKSTVWLIPVAILLVLTAMWAIHLQTTRSKDRNDRLFTNIRDHILLSNRVGRAVNDFYYRYTLYAAEAFKSFELKTIRIGRLEGIPDEGSKRRMRALLARHNVLILAGFDRPDIILEFSNSGVWLKSTDNQGIHMDTRQFISNPGNGLRSYSAATYRLVPFRTIIYVGLLVGFPVFLFVVVYGFLRSVAGYVTGERRTVCIASTLCLGIGIALFLPMLGARPLQLSNEGLDQALSSDRWTRRVAALRHIEARGLEITRYPSYEHLLSSPMMVERYWLARALAESRASATYPQLLALLDDPHPNVVCQAIYALGKQGRPKAIKPIRDKLVRTDHWYSQRYAYWAMRRLGWYQVPSR